MKTPTPQTPTEISNSHNAKNSLFFWFAFIFLLAASASSQAAAIDIKLSDNKKSLDSEPTKPTTAIAWENSDSSASNITGDKKYIFTDNSLDTSAFAQEKKGKKNTSIPEPATFLLMLTGVVSLMMARKK